MSKNNCCRVCDTKYHYCGSCSPDEAMDLRCCSDACLGKVPILDLLEDQVEDLNPVAIRAKVEIERLQVIVAEMSKCWRLNEDKTLVQDVVVTEGMSIWVLEMWGEITGPHDACQGIQVRDAEYPLAINTNPLIPDRSFNTREAAEALLNQQQPENPEGKS